MYFFTKRIVPRVSSTLCPLFYSMTFAIRHIEYHFSRLGVPPLGLRVLWVPPQKGGSEGDVHLQIISNCMLDCMWPSSKKIASTLLIWRAKTWAALNSKNWAFDLHFSQIYGDLCVWLQFWGLSQEDFFCVCVLSSLKLNWSICITYHYIEKYRQNTIANLTEWIDM